MALKVLNRQVTSSHYGFLMRPSKKRWKTESIRLYVYLSIRLFVVVDVKADDDHKPRVILGRWHAL